MITQEGWDMQNFDYHMPVKVHFGNRITENEHHFNLPYYKALIVTNQAMSQKENGHLTTIIKNLETHQTKAIVYDEITRPLTKECVISGAEMARDFGCDVIIGLGGGKALDAAKLIARFVKEDFTLLDAWIKSRTVPPFDHEPMPSILIPTTLNLSSGLNHLAYIHLPGKAQFFRFKDESLYSKTTLIDPFLSATLDEQAFYPPLIDTLLRSVEILIEEKSLMHRMHALNAIELILKHTAYLEKRPPDQTVLYHLSYAVYTLSGIPIPKTILPLHQIGDTIEGYHEQLPHSVFTMQGFLPYLEYRIGKLQAHDESALLHIFKTTPYHSNNVMVAFKNFYSSLNIAFCDLNTFGVDLALVSDYIVHLKAVFPSFTALKDDELYTIIEETLLKN